MLATVHREANVRPERLARIVEGLTRLDEPVVFPAHRARGASLDDEASAPGRTSACAEPLGYLDLLRSPRRRA